MRALMLSWGLLVLLASGCGESTPVFLEPPVIEAEDGVLSLTLTPKYTNLSVNDLDLEGRAYMGLFAPATLRVARGDRFEILLENQLPSESTNLHFDGMSLSPLMQGWVAGDDVFLDVEPGEGQLYSVVVPEDHPQGIFTYRPSRFGEIASQLGNGMAGAIVVEGVLDPFPQLSGVTQRTLVLKDLQRSGGTIFEQPDPEQLKMLTVNGQVRPRFKANPGEMQFWSVANASANLYYRLALANHTFYEVARDGNRHTRLLALQNIDLPPSARSQFLIVARGEGQYEFSTATLGNRPPDYDAFFGEGSSLYRAGACGEAELAETTGCEDLDASTCMGPQGPCVVGGSLGTLVVADDKVLAPQLPSEDQFPALTDLREENRCRRRVFRFEQGPTGDVYTIDGRPFDPYRIDAEVRLASEENCVEEWRLQNCSGQNHVFHIGQVDFQVLEVNGVPVEFTGYQDTVTMPFRDCDRYESDATECQAVEIEQKIYPIYSCPTANDPRGEVVVRIPFSEIAVGKFTFRSAAANASDAGMMAAMQVCDDDQYPCGAPQR
ncbi:MAG: multicopper oxidase domain-containing protein [Candidatus Binatia bacterium]|nr:multicopper oxidase domain-containing protein [Candidatus Binatia bacterium]MDG2008692.1 multicopper oxidase domain-containing protein [Candidatus Binatia bacterium]